MAGIPRRRDGFLRIREYALLGDGSTAALVGRDGSIDWLCWPRFDSPSVFGRLLDRRGGHFSVTVDDAREADRTYRPGTNVLSTRFRGPDGEAEVVDAMVLERGEEHRLASGNALVRSVRCAGGRVSVEVSFAPRPGYGAASPRLRRTGNGAVALADGERVGLGATHPLTVDEGEARLRTDLTDGQRLDLVATWGREPPPISPAETDRMIRETERAWRGWASGLTYEGPYREAVERSALVLKALDYTRTGAIVASPTTSLPERVGGVRNWDYRFAWVRDVAFAVYALRRVGYDREAGDFLDWLFVASRCRPEDVRVLYAIDGALAPRERKLESLEGYRGSAPVRVGNAAATQRQLDAFGEILDSLHLFRMGGGTITPAMWQCIRSQVGWLTRNWYRPDYSIWEVRTQPQRFTYSAAMSHVAFDRAIRAAEDLDFRAPLDRWKQERERSLRAVEASWSDRTKAFAQSVGGDDLDAAMLALPLRRVIAPDDPRMHATVEAVRRGLDAGGGLLHRYLAPDGLPAGEGAFVMCSFWLVDCLTMQGRREEATELYERMVGHANDVGLLAEEIDPSTGDFLGNFPQGFSHIGVIASAVNLGRPAIPQEP